MALALNDRVQQTGTANTTVSFTLSGAVTGFQSFAVIGNGNTTFYAATDGTGNWEVGVGTYSTTGPTLTRTTILASSNAGAAVTFSGTVNVFVTYPSEKSVNLDASGNVSALGTIASGTWQGSTIGTLYGGTGVTTSTGNNSVVLRDANSNITANNALLGYTSVTAAAGTTTLTAASTYYQRLTGTLAQTFQLPVATTLPNGAAFIFDNDSTGVLTITDNATATVDTVAAGAFDYIFLEDNSTSAGSWGKYSFLPATYDFNTTSAAFGNATISNAVWNGTVIGTAFGGTGLSGATPFTAANNAIYSTSASALAAGTLPTAAGGTALTAFTLNGAMYATSTSALTTGTLPIASGGTNSTATATAGGIGYGTGTAHAYTAAGTSGNALISAGAGAPAFGNLALGTANTNVSGALTVTNGGTGVATLTGIVKGTGTTAFTAATAGTDYSVGTSALATGMLKSTTTTGALSIGTAGTDYSAGTSALATGILKSTTTTGALSIAVGGTDYQTAQSVTGIVKSSGTTRSAATAATDYVAPSAYASANGLTMATARLLGRTTAATGAAEEITVGSGLTLSAGTLSTSSGTSLYVRTSFTATAGQTVFTVTYTVGFIQVYLNGVLLNATDYTASSGTSITLATAAAVGDIVETVAFSTGLVAGSVNSVGTAGTVNGLTLTGGPITSTGTITLGGTLDLSSPPTIGGTTPGLITGTTITANTGFAGPHNGTVGATTPNTGAFTTLSASSTVSGTGFSTYLASPPAIGGTAANTGRFSAVTTTAGTASVAPITLTSGTNLTTAAAGAVEFDSANTIQYFTGNTTNGRGVTPTVNMFRLLANGAATATTISPFFGATSSIPLVANGVYEIEIECYFTKTTAGTLVWTLTNSAVVTYMNANFQMSAITGVATAGQAPLTGYLVAQTAAAAAFGATGSLTTAVNHFIKFKILLENASSTSLRLNVTNSAGTVTPLRGSYWKATRIPATNNSTYAA